MAEKRSILNPVTGERFTEIVRGIDNGGEYAEARVSFPVGARPPGIHRHRHQDEVVTVVSGRIRAKVGRHEREYGPGESAFLPRGEWHDFWVVGDDPVETIGRATPALGIELLLPTLAGLAAEGKTDKRGRPRPLQGAVMGQFFDEVAQFKMPPPAVQKVLIPVLAAIGRRRGCRPYYDRHFEEGEIAAVLAHWAAHRSWDDFRPPPHGP